MAKVEETQSAIEVLADKEKIEEEKKRREAKLVEIKKRLCANVMKGNWDEVEKMYTEELKELPEVRSMKITKSGATALHIAVYEGNEKTVKTLVRMMEKDLMKKEVTRDENGNESVKEVVALLKDNRGNTPLHLAAEMGNDEMCRCIALKAPRLIGIRNDDGETPLLLTALHGKKKVFITFHLIYMLFNNQINDEYSWEQRQGDLYRYGRRNSDGRTVLHCAIDGEYFETAYEIIVRLPKFHNYVDEQGYTPFHLLASKQSSFKSSCRRTLLQKLIYKCVPAPAINNYTAVDFSLRGPATEQVDFPEEDTIQGKHHKRTDVENPPLPNLQRKRNLICQTVKHLYETTVSCLKGLKSGVRFFPEYMVLKSVVRFFPKYMAEMKTKHTWAAEIMNILVKRAGFDFDLGIRIHLAGGRKRIAGSEALRTEEEHDISESQSGFFTLSFWDTKTERESPLLIATKNGISEIVEAILDKYPVTIHDVNSEGKNMLHLAVENRQSHIYQLLQQRRLTGDLFNSVDNDGNNALHLVALFNPYRFWIVPNAVLQMQWEIKWYEYIKESVPRHLLAQPNNEGKTPNEIFLVTHKDLLKDDKEWLMKTSEQCSIIATLIATVAFATSASVPGGVRGNNGQPVLSRQGMFEFFAISSLVALCSSLTAVAIFLSIFTSRHQVTDFSLNSLLKLVYGLMVLFVAVISMLISFCGGHFFVLREVVKDARAIEYVAVFLPVTYFVLILFPLYYHILVALLTKVPQRGYTISA